LARARDANRVVILDTTMRDGERSPGCSLNLEVKAAR
jgi:2-isopropylmalate synthase